MKNKFVMSFSGGKDSTLSLYRMINMGHIPIALLVTTKKDAKRSWTHGINQNLLNKISDSLNIPLFEVNCHANEYEYEFEKMLIHLKSIGATHCAFGDIDIDNHRKWCTNRCDNTGLLPVFPLWQEDREDVVHEFIDSGFKTLISTVNLKYLSSSYLGKTLDKNIISQIKADGADACGENGEYHTFVYDGPIFKQKINFEIKEIVSENNYAHLDIQLCE